MTSAATERAIDTNENAPNLFGCVPTLDNRARPCGRVSNENASGSSSPSSSGAGATPRDERRPHRKRHWSHQQQRRRRWRRPRRRSAIPARDRFPRSTPNLVPVNSIRKGGGMGRETRRTCERIGSQQKRHPACIRFPRSVLPDLASRLKRTDSTDFFFP